MKLEDVLPVDISLDAPCKGCELNFEREEYEYKFWHVWEGRAYPCTRTLKKEDGKDESSSSGTTS